MKTHLRYSNGKMTIVNMKYPTSLKFKEDMTNCYNKVADTLNNSEDYKGNIEIELRLNKVYELLTEIINLSS